MADELTLAHPVLDRYRTFPADKRKDADRYLAAGWTVVGDESGELEPASDVPIGEVAAVPEGTVGDVLAWVDGDPGRAQAALLVERNATYPRSTLIGQLEQTAEIDTPDEGEKETDE